eukprot:2219347-Prymnesium_polylepis.2
MPIMRSGRRGWPKGGPCMPPSAIVKLNRESMCGSNRVRAVRCAARPLPKVCRDDTTALCRRRWMFFARLWPMAYGAPEGGTRALRGSAVPRDRCG